MKTVWRKLEVQYSFIQFLNSEGKYIKNIFNVSGVNMRMISSHLIFPLKNFKAAAAFFFFNADDSVFNIMLKLLFGLLSVLCITYEKKTNEYQIQAFILLREIGKKLLLYKFCLL